MPRTCHTSLIIQGDKKDLDRIEETGLDFERIRPMPPEILGWPRNMLARAVMMLYGIVARKDPSVWPVPPDDPDDRLPRWYTWRIQNWGTPRNASEIDIRYWECTGGIQAQMRTAGGPPTALLKYMSGAYRVLIHAYHDEEGEMFHRTQTFDGGMIIDRAINYGFKA